jgi:hypothetical protein
MATVAGYTRAIVPMAVFLPRLAAFLLAALGLALGAEATAYAYPQWQLASGSARCNECHYAPAGGGLLTGYGRDAIGSELSTFSGDGNLLHGRVTPPRWLAVGGNFRGAFVANGVQDPGGPATALFPMQADVHARVALPQGISVSGTIGLRGQARSSDAPVPPQDPQPAMASRLISREHYVMWQPQTVGPYVRLGRFYAPFGLRFPEHILYVRRDLGFDLLRESYNLSGGWTLPSWELHLTAFAPDFIRRIGSDEKGFAASFERRLLDDRLALGAQARVADAAGVTRYIWGGVAKFYFEPLRTLALAEVDTVHLSFDAATVGARTQVVAVGGLATFPVRGVILTALAERNQMDVRVAGAAWTAATLLANWFPYPHVELQVIGRLQFPAGAPAAKTLFMQLHYFL